MTARRFLGTVILAGLGVSTLPAQQVSFSAAPEGPNAETIARLAEQIIPRYAEENRVAYLTNVGRLYLGAGRYADALSAIAALRDQASSAEGPAVQQAILRSVPVDIYARARRAQRDAGLTFEEAYDRSFREVFQRLSDGDAVEAAWIVASPASNSRQTLQ